MGEHALGCAADDRGRVFCWAKPPNEILGERPDKHDSLYGVPVPEPVTSLEILAASDTACAVTRNETVLCWGGNAFGVLGRGSPDPASTRPLPVKGLSGVRQLATAGKTICAVTAGGEVWCWGQLSWDQKKAHDVPVRVDVPRAKRIAATSLGGFCAIVEGGSVSCWGQTFASPATPTAPKQTTDLEASALGKRSSTCFCALDKGGALTCKNCPPKFVAAWPKNLATPPDRGSDLWCAVTKDAHVFCMLIDDAAAKELPELTGAKELALGADVHDRRVCAVLEDKRACCMHTAYASAMGMPGNRLGDATCLPAPP